MPVQLETIPAYKRATRRGAALQEKLREAAFLNLPASICGVEVRQLNARHMLLLFRTKSPFFCGGDIGPGDVAAFLWCVSPHYLPLTDPRGHDARRAFVARVATVPFLKAKRAIQRMIYFATLDRPPVNAKKARQPAATCFIGSLVHIIASKYRMAAVGRVGHAHRPKLSAPEGDRARSRRGAWRKASPVQPAHRPSHEANPQKSVAMKQSITSTAAAKIRNIGVRVKKTLGQVLDQEARGVAISMARSTQPFGTGGAAKDMGEAAVARDIARVYAKPRDVYGAIRNKGAAAGFWAAVQKGDIHRAQGFIPLAGSAFDAGATIGAFDGGSAHAARDSRGRVRQGRPSRVVTPGDVRALVAYADRKKSHVGFAKSAWAQIARELGGIRGLRAARLPGGEKDITANWITRQRGPSSVSRSGYESASARVSMTSRVSYASQALPAGAKANAIRIARDRLRKSIAIAARYEARQALRAA